MQTPSIDASPRARAPHSTSTQFTSPRSYADTIAEMPGEQPSWSELLGALRDVQAGAPVQPLVDALAAAAPRLLDELPGRPRSATELAQVRVLAHTAPRPAPDAVPMGRAVSISPIAPPPRTKS